MTAFVTNAGIVMLYGANPDIEDEVTADLIDEQGGEEIADRELYGDTEKKCLTCGHDDEMHRKSVKDGERLECHRFLCKCGKYE